MVHAFVIIIIVVVVVVIIVRIVGGRTVVVKNHGFDNVPQDAAIQLRQIEFHRAKHGIVTRTITISIAIQVQLDHGEDVGFFDAGCGADQSLSAGPGPGVSPVVMIRV